MTTSVVVKANHGWPVRVTPLSVGGQGAGPVQIVEAGAEGMFSVHSGQDLLVHEIQPAEREKGSLGEYRVGISFNPSISPVVDLIKQQAAALIDYIDGIPSDRETEAGNERGRLKSLAMTAIEDAAMWAVKAATKPARSCTPRRAP